MQLKRNKSCQPYFPRYLINNTNLLLYHLLFIVLYYAIPFPKVKKKTLRGITSSFPNRVCNNNSDLIKFMKENILLTTVNIPMFY